MVDYSFYETVYLGTSISQKAFPGLAARAQAELDRMKRCFRVVSAGEDSEKLALCAVAEVLARQDKSRGVQSASVGGVSVHYADDTGARREIYRAAGVYLDIYRGVG